MDKITVVTGGEGFIGSHVVRNLQARGNRVLVSDRFPPKQRSYLVSGTESLNWTRLLDWFTEYGTEVEAIIHLGAISDTLASNRKEIWEHNVECSKALWGMAAALGIPFVYASSAATYGADWRCDDQVMPRLLKPLNLYGESKNAFDDWALQQDRQGQAPPVWRGLKYFNVYGPNEGHKGRMASAVWQFYHQIEQTGVARIFEAPRGHAEPQRDFVYVADVVRATLRMVSATKVENGLYNVGTGSKRTFKELAQCVFRALGRLPWIEQIPMPEELRASYQYFTLARTDKLREALPELEFRSLELGVWDYVEALRECY
jgi:ADP-L-glycero-D-manno-heptose 6-epimerase